MRHSLLMRPPPLPPPSPTTHLSSQMNSRYSVCWWWHLSTASKHITRLLASLLLSVPCCLSKPATYIWVKCFLKMSTEWLMILIYSSLICTHQYVPLPDSLCAAGVCRQFLEDKEIDTIDWPPRLPDQNPIKHHWDIFFSSDRCCQVAPHTVQELMPGSESGRRCPRTPSIFW